MQLVVIGAERVKRACLAYAQRRTKAFAFPAEAAALRKGDKQYKSPVADRLKVVSPKPVLFKSQASEQASVLTSSQP